LQVPYVNEQGVERVKTAQQAAQNWEQSAGRAATSYAAGVNNYSGDWAGATTRQQSVMQTNWQQSVSSGQWANGVNRVGTNGWKQATQSKVSNYSTGFSAGASNQAASIAKILQAEANIVGSLPPRGDYNQNKARATAVMDGLHALKGTLGA
jgi:hypothetical protein